MRKFLSRVFVVAGMLAMVACGGSGGDSKFETPGNNGTPPPTGATPASVSVLSSSPTIQSASTTPIDISAYVKDANNALIQGVTVTFASSSGQLNVTQPKTDATGLAKATLVPGADPANRDITVTVTAGSATGTVNVSVTGTQLTLQGPSAMVMGQSAQYSVRLLDSAGKGISAQKVTVASARSNTLSATSVTTDASGNATFNLTVTNATNDTVTLTGLGITTTANIAVSSDAFSFQTPAASAEILLGVDQQISVRWLHSGTPVVGQPVLFSSTRGAVSAGSAITDANGVASVTVKATNSGIATLSATASGSGGATATLPIEFVANTVGSVDLQPTIFTMPPNGESTLTATVRDPNNNLVKNQRVTFSLEDVTGGTLTIGSAMTDSLGRAQSTYKAGPSTSASDGVHITATVQGTSVTDTINLTVAQAQLFIRFGTGNKLETGVPGVNPATQYSLPYTIQVTDANGNGVPNVPLAVKVLSTSYGKGVRRGVPDSNGVEQPPWSTDPDNLHTCPDEDVNHNGVLDRNANPALDEDKNGSGQLEAGNVATIVSDSLTSDSKGFANIHIVYPQDVAEWVQVVLDVRAGVSGTEYVRQAFFGLPGLLDDFDGPGPAPGMTSPFGVNTCDIKN